MPAVARVLSQETKEPPAHSSLDILQIFISNMVDHLVRSSTLEDSAHIFPSRPDPLRKRVAHSLHDQWLRALHSPNGEIEGKPEELRHFTDLVKEWSRPIWISTSTPFRLCFRIEEPKDGDGQWYVRYLLQANHDPSLLIPAE
ncbi:MAG: hypothetical protein HXY46_04110 [Syntrophaceae bacterium]|nr:hypothetical protein [Syntrophaceae bacterium]